jgi:hypothetical protein
MRIVKESIDVATGIFTTGFWATNSNLSYVDINKNSIGVDQLRFRCMFCSFRVWNKLQ